MLSLTEMMDDVIYKWGIEHEYTIDFCQMVESEEYSDDAVLDYYTTLMTLNNFCEE